MNKKLLLVSLLAMAVSAQAQKIDFNFFGRQAAQVTAEGFTPWVSATTTHDGFPKNCVKDSMTVDGIKIVVENGPNSGGQTLGCGWNKNITQSKDKLIGDGIEVLALDDDGNTPKLQGPVGEIQFTITGLTAGRHTLLAYHNNPTSYQGPAIDVYVNGQQALSGVQQTMNKEKASDAATSYISFNAEEGKPVVVAYRSVPDANADYTSKSPYQTSTVFINAIVFDEGNPSTMAMNPYPADYDYHANCDGGTVTLRWSPAGKAKKHHLFFGKSKDAMEDKGLLTDTAYTVSGLYSMDTYYWQVREVDAEGSEYDAATWSFQPRHLAFPGAEGYGRFAKGGRGGSVYHVTNLKNDHTPGSLLYGLVDITEPHTIVFDVSGLIVMDFGSVFTKGNVTIAAQTAPGKGICLKHSNVNFGNDNIVRFLRAHRGLGTSEQTGNAMGVTGAYNCIVDHTTAAWGTDETFSSRGAHSITFQKSMIAEALGIAHHKNYSDGKNHGFAATIGGDIGSFHHNLLVHCNGRNWSMGGGLDGDGYYSGRLDIFNNVVYNWHGRTTDGGAHEVNFVGNYYKEGPAVSNHCLFTLQLEGTGKGTQSAYVKNNIRDRLNGTLDLDKADMKAVQISSNQKVDWTYWGTEPYFPSEATIDDPVLAYKKVLSDVGANQPVFDDHDQRMIRETRDRSYTYVGSLSGIKGEIDNEEDAGGWEVFPEESRGADFDTDQDGIPNWWEQIAGTDQNTANNNADTNRDGYTELEDYLNFMAEEHRLLSQGEKVKVNLKAIFAGFTNSPKYTYDYSGRNLTLSLQQDSILEVTAGKDNSINEVKLTVTDADNHSMTRLLNVAITNGTTGIEQATAGNSEAKSYEIFTLSGMKVAGGHCNGRTIAQLADSNLTDSVYVVNVSYADGTTRNFKIAR